MLYFIIRHATNTMVKGLEYIKIKRSMCTQNIEKWKTKIEKKTKTEVPRF